MQLLTALLTDILLAADGVPVTVRLLDVPRHELVDGSVGDADLSAVITEIDPMMGTRGVRDFLVNADLGVAQVAAIARETPGTHSCPPAVGCMIEVPRIALHAADLAEHADFLSIGSNDLTQFILAMSRDDADAGFLGSYLRDQVITTNPFEQPRS